MAPEEVLGCRPGTVGTVGRGRGKHIGNPDPCRRARAGAPARRGSLARDIPSALGYGGDGPRHRRRRPVRRPVRPSRGCAGANRRDPGPRAEHDGRDVLDRLWTRIGITSEGTERPPPARWPAQATTGVTIGHGPDDPRTGSLGPPATCTTRTRAGPPIGGESMPERAHRLRLATLVRLPGRSLVLLSAAAVVAAAHGPKRVLPARVRSAARAAWAPEARRSPPRCGRVRRHRRRPSPGAGRARAAAGPHLGHLRPWRCVCPLTRHRAGLARRAEET